MQKEQGERGAVDPKDAANQPKSKEAGQPSVANSCQVGPHECYETPYSQVGSGYYSDKKKCPGTFGTGPCPSENRKAYCLLSNHQLISLYPANGSFDVDRKKKNCEGVYKGTWLGLPTKRPWPVN